MAVSSRGQPRTEAGADLALLPDERLLELFQAQRREDCFAELARRHMDSAFRVAFARCGRRELAEEAVQEAFFRLSRAGIAAPGETATPFKLRLLGIVSSLALNSLRSERRISQRTPVRPLRDEAPDIHSTSVPEREIRDALLRALGALKDEQRLPIVLHFMEGLTQAQIGNLVGVAQSVVARRIAVGLTTLRWRLAQVGIKIGALALPGLLQLEARLQAPPALRLQLTSPSQRSASFQRACSPKPLPISFSAAAAWTVPFVLLATGALVALAWQVVQTQPPEFGTKSYPERRPDTLATSQMETGSTTCDRTWDFRSAPPTDMTVLEGDWHWVKGKGMETNSPNFLHVLLPMAAVKLPVRAEFHMALPDHRKSGHAAIYFTEGRSIPPSTVWPGGYLGKNEPYLVIVAYLTRTRVVNVFNNELTRLEEFATPLPQARLCLTFQSAVVGKLMLKSIPASEVPFSEADLEDFKRRRGAGIAQGSYNFRILGPGSR